MVILGETRRGSKMGQRGPLRWLDFSFMIYLGHLFGETVPWLEISLQSHISEIMHGVIAQSTTYWLVQDWERSMTGLSAVSFVSSTEHVMRNTVLDELQARIKTGRRKHQQPQICGWHHSNGRKWRGTKEPLVEGEGGESRSLLKIKH